jgi:Uncharacterized ACR, COG1678
VCWSRFDGRCANVQTRGCGKRALRDKAYAVVYLPCHDPDGTMGLIVNAPIGDFPLATLPHQTGLNSAGVAGTIQLHRGGPVETTRVFGSHTDDDAASDTFRIGGGLDQRPIGTPNAVHYILSVADGSSLLPG